MAKKRQENRQITGAQPALESLSVSAMEPMLPPEGDRRLEDVAFDVIAKASAFAGQIHPIVRDSVSELVRSMNCYYSNLIEGHHTRPRDIDRALAADYAKQPERRALQLEAVAHIEVQQRIDRGEDDRSHPTSIAYIRWTHGEFCRRLPDDLLWVAHPETGKRVRVVPGELRDCDVEVGRHIPPPAQDVPRFLARFEEAYAPERLSKVRQVVATAAAHHRLAWIHPFFEGNGRVARLVSHAMLQRMGLGSSLWSVARGLARSVTRYKALLMAADEPRTSDHDGRGALSLRALTEFCAYFLETCIDQVDFMAALLAPGEILRRIERYCDDEIDAGRLGRGSFAVLREAWLAGEVERGKLPSLVGASERTARNVVAKIVQRGLLTSPSSRAPLRLRFDFDVIDRWFPRLYPSDQL